MHLQPGTGCRNEHFLLDTNILSELSRPQPNPHVLAWSARIPRIAISVITLEELRFGVAAHPGVRLQRWLDEILLQVATVIPVDQAKAEWAGTQRGKQRLIGRTLTQADALIAATAALEGLTLVTRNVRDFQGLGLSLLNPFDD